MLTKSTVSYIALGVVLVSLSLAFLNLPALRLPIAILIGLSYFFWGIITHWHDKTLHVSLVLEYLSISLLATILLIFITLRA